MQQSRDIFGKLEFFFIAAESLPEVLSKNINIFMTKTCFKKQRKTKEFSPLNCF